MQLKIGTRVEAVEGVRDIEAGDAGTVETTPTKAMVGVRWDRIGFAVINRKRLAKLKTVRNLMSGKEIEIPEDTPLACDPSSETYWSM